MAGVNGLSRRMSFVTAPGGATNIAAHEPVSAAGTPATGVPAVIDGTPVRVAMLALGGAAGLILLRLGGFKFNVAVSN